MIGQSLGHYRIMDRLGEGGMGVVYKALDTRLNRQVAIKVLPQELTADPERRLRFQREAQTAAALDHPNIATIHEIGEHEGSQYIVMQLVEGRTLREVIGHRPLPLKEWLRVALPIAEGLAHAHARQVIHRDLKPDNVMITGERQVKILDFGLAKLLEPEAAAGGAAGDVQSRMETISRELTRAGKVFGTVAYMSPEQARGERADHRSDLFSLGIVLYQMATGRLPFKGKSDIETLHAIIAGEPLPLSEAAGDYPQEAERVVRKAMEKEPERRYQHADDLSTDLRNLQRDLDSGRVSVPSGSAQVVVAGEPPRTRIWRRPVVAIAGAAVVAAALLAGGIYLYRARQATEEAATPPLKDRAVGVIGFENLSNPGDPENLGRMLMGLVTTDLAESGGLRVVSTPKILAALRQAGQAEGKGFDASIASEAAREAGAQVMLVGQFSQIGEQLLLTAELVDVESGNTLGSHKKEAPSRSELFSLAGGIAAEVRRRLGASEGASGDLSRSRASRPFDLAQALTDSPEAYRQYVAGELALHQGRFAEAVDRFRRAINEDPTFALAYYRLAMAQEWNGNVQEAQAAYKTGLRHITRLPLRWQTVYQASYDYERGEFDASYKALTRLIESSPDMPDAYNRLGEIVTHSTRHIDTRKAREFFEKALELDPTFKLVFFHLIHACIAGEDLEAAERLLVRYREENPADPAVIQAEVVILLAQGRYEDATARAQELMVRGHTQVWISLIDSYLKTGNWERAYSLAEEAIGREVGYMRSFGFVKRGQAQLGRGRLEAALADLGQAASWVHTSEPSLYWFASIASGFQIDRAKLFLLSGNIEDAVEAAREAIRVDALSHGAYFWLGRIFLAAGRKTEAEQALEQLETAARETLAPTGKSWVHLLKAEIYLAEGSVPRAAAEVERASAFAPEYRDRMTEWIVRARVRAASGDRSGAIVAYREAFNPKFGWWSWRGIMETHALYLIARLEEETGDLASARKHYGEFLDRWGNADIPIPDVKDAKARLAALSEAEAAGIR